MAAKKASSVSKPNDEGKTIAIVSYITWIGWVIALIMNMDKKNDFAKFHLRQTLIIWLAGIALWVFAIIPILGWILSPILGIALFVLWIIGLIGAVNGEKKEVPLLGPLAQDWFKGL